MITTIQLDDKVKAKLDNLKVHYRESYNELIKRLVENFSPKEDKIDLIETIDILSDPTTMRSLAHAMDNISKLENKKYWVSWEEVKKKAGL